jgi:hypothetical protein
MVGVHIDGGKDVTTFGNGGFPKEIAERTISRLSRDMGDN